jgi:hypothetical protein
VIYPLCGERVSELKRAKLSVAWHKCRHCTTQWCEQCLPKGHLKVHELTCAARPVPVAHAVPAAPATPAKKKRKPESDTPPLPNVRPPLQKKPKVAYVG